MSRSIHIFINAPIALELLAKEISSLLGVDLEQYTDPYETWYEFHGVNTALSLGAHDFENDGELNFEDYPYDIELWVFNIYAPEEREQRLAQWAEHVYQTLRAIEKYPLLLVDDVQVKLAEPGVVPA